MKALAVLAACLLLTLPAEAFVRAGGGPAGGFHPGGPAHPGGGPNGGRYRHGYRNGGYYGGDAAWVGGAYVEPPAEPAQASAPAEPEVVYQPVPYCPTPARPKTGPHITYIGQKPAIHGPRIIYGTD